MKKELFKFTTIILGVTSLVFLGFMLKQGFDLVPQLADQFKNFITFLSANLLSIMGLILSVYLVNQEEKKEQEEILERVFILKQEEISLGGQLQEMMNHMATADSVSADFKQRLNNLSKEIIKNGEASDREILKLLKKQMKK